MSDSYDFGGTFRIAFEGRATLPLPAICSASEMKTSLNSLPTIGFVSVSRMEILDGHMWLVTFLTNNGDQRWFGDIKSLTDSVDTFSSPLSLVNDTKNTTGR